MGIRIHRAMGYAWDKLDPDQYKPNDKNYSVGQFLVWCKSNQKKIEDLYMSGPYLNPLHREHYQHELKLSYLKSYDSNLAAKSIDRYIYVDSEYGLKNVILFRPIGFEDWYRHDNIIDYMEASCNQDGPINNLVKLCTTPTRLDPSERNGIFPFLFRRPPANIAAMCLWTGLEEIYTKLEEAIYTWWG